MFNKSRLPPVFIFHSYISIAQTLLYILQTVLILIWGSTYHSSSWDLFLLFLWGAFAYFHCENHFLWPILCIRIPCNERKNWCVHSPIFSPFLARSLSGMSVLWILYISVVSLSLSVSLPLLHTYLRLWLLFSILLGSPSTLSLLTFFPRFPSLSFSPLSLSLSCSLALSQWKAENTQGSWCN